MVGCEWRRGIGLALLALASACAPGGPEPEARCEGLGEGSLVLTELLADPEGTDTGKEWLEWHNPGSTPVELQGLTLFASQPDGSRERTYTLSEPLPVPPGGYVVLGDVRSGPLPEYMQATYGNALGALPNTGGRLGLRCAGQVLQEVSYAAPLRSGHSRSYSGRWCDLTPSPGKPNPPCPEEPGQQPDTGNGSPGPTCLPQGVSSPRSPVAPQPGDLVVSELLIDPRATPDSLGEWVEVYAYRDFDLNGLTLSTESASTTLQSSQCLSVRAGSFALLARSSKPEENGGLPAVLATLSIGLPNGSGEHLLRLEAEGQVLEELTWAGSAPSGVAWQLDLEDMVSYCLAPEEARYGAGDRGSPGEENPPCAH